MRYGICGREAKGGETTRSTTRQQRQPCSTVHCLNSDLNLADYVKQLLLNKS